MTSTMQAAIARLKAAEQLLAEQQRAYSSWPTTKNEEALSDAQWAVDRALEALQERVDFAYSWLNEEIQTGRATTDDPNFIEGLRRYEQGFSALWEEWDAEDRTRVATGQTTKGGYQHRGRPGQS